MMTEFASFRLRCREAEAPIRTAPIRDFETGARGFDPEGADFLRLVAPSEPVEGVRLTANPYTSGVPHPAVTAPSGDWRLGTFQPRSRSRLLAAMAAATPMALAPALGHGQESPAQEVPVLIAQAEAVWDAVVGRTVEIIFEDGSSMTGEVLSHKDGDVVVALKRDGSVRTVSKSRVQDVRVVSSSSSSRSESRDSRSDRERDKYAAARSRLRGMRTTGVVFTFVGVGLLTAWGLTMAGTGGDYFYYTIPVGITATTFIGIGIPLWAAGDAGVRTIDRKRRRRGALPDGSGLYLTVQGADRGKRWEGKLTLRF